MTSISLEQQKFVLSPKRSETETLVLSEKTLLPFLVLRISCKDDEINTRFNLLATYYNKDKEPVSVNYSTINFFAPYQDIFLAPIHAEKHKDFLCSYITFDVSFGAIKTDPETPISITIGAYKFDDQKERETAIIHSQYQNPKDGSFPDYKDEL